MSPPKASEILDMQGERSQFQHVIKHLYNPRERWQQVVSCGHQPLQAAWAAGCSEAELDRGWPDEQRVSASCLAHVLLDHERYLAPAYRASLAEAEAAGRVGSDRKDAQAWFFVGDRGVVVVVRCVSDLPSPVVKTAYRVTSKRGQGTPKAFFKRAVRKLRDKTSWSGGGL